MESLLELSDRGDRAVAGYPSDLRDAVESRRAATAGRGVDAGDDREDALLRLFFF